MPYLSLNTPLSPLPAKPLVSVVLNSYNYARYLQEALDSVFKQTYDNLELIAVDDGSEDASPGMIEAAVSTAPFPARHLLRTNGGQAAALNAGLAAARGDLICTLDSDDFWAPDKVARMVALAQALPDGGLYQHQLYNDGGMDKSFLPSGDLYGMWRELGVVNVALHQHTVAIFVPTSGLMWRREVLEEVLPIPEALVTCADAYLTRMSCCFGPLYSLPEPLGTWRLHENNAGRMAHYNFKKFWLPVILPALNEGLARLGAPIRYSYRPWEVLWEPWRMLVRAGRRRRARR